MNQKELNAAIVSNAKETQEDAERYYRQILLPSVGEKGQEIIQSLRILIFGSGALGCSCAELLTRAGVQFLRLVDRDVVEWSNLQRQHLFDESDARERRPKVDAAKRRLENINHRVEIEAIVLDVNATNIELLLKGVDAVIDATDRLEERYLLNDVCVKHGIPWVYAAIRKTSAVWMPLTSPNGPCLRCVFPEKPEKETLNAGVWGPAVSTTGGMEVSQLLRYFIEGKPDSSTSVLTEMNLWNNTFVQIPVEKNPKCPCCVGKEFAFLNKKSF